MKNSTLKSGFLRSCNKFPERTALEVAGESWSYAQLLNEASRLAATLQSLQPETKSDLTAVLAHRSPSAFTGILGSLLRGHGYVPVNPNLPSDRIINILNRSGCESLVVGSEATADLGKILKEVEKPLCIFFPDVEDIEHLETKFSQHRFVPANRFVAPDEWTDTDPDESMTAYLLFTSGSTGTPKGVDVSHKNIRHFIDFVVDRYDIDEHDRFSQMFELVFDLSLFDIFVAWECGACICCPSKGDAQMPARYINESGITIWFSVPSLAVSMTKMRMLQPDVYPKLRLSLFCGEALLNDTAQMWSKAAPNSIVENLYGPTEVTLACTYFTWNSTSEWDEYHHSNVPIGYAFDGSDAIIVDEQLLEVADGAKGELLMSGPQVATGYWHDLDRTEAAFIFPPGKSTRYYRTGDLVRRSSVDAPIEYVGRIDNQVKIRGNRVELGEIEAVLRKVPSVIQAIAVGWPCSTAGVDGVTVFLQGDDIDIEAVRSRVSSSLPSYMIPRDYKCVDEMPLNQNGKIDRNALLAVLQDG